MKISIRFHQVNQLNEVYTLVDGEARKPSRLFPEIVGCVVVIDKPSNRHRKGNPIRAHVTVSIPGKTMAFSKRADGQDEAVCALAALSFAFDAVEKTVGEYTKKQREAEERQYRALFEAAFVPIQ